jgi:hypothetical protein
VVPLAQIPARLAAIGQQIAPAAADRTMRPEGYNATDIQTIIALLQEKVGQDFSAYKRGTLERRIHRRMGLHPAPANKTIAVGEAITFEGPYGRFDFEPVRGAQLCIGGGVGITPFIARMETLTMSGHLADVDLIYSTAAPDDGFIAEVRNAAAASGVRLHLVDTGRDGFVDLKGSKAGSRSGARPTFGFAALRRSAMPCIRPCARTACRRTAFTANCFR